MGKKASGLRRVTKRTMRATPLTGPERTFLREHAGYEGIAYHKRSPGDFGLTPPAAPRLDKPLCDEANVTQRSLAHALLAQAIEGGLVSDAEGAPRFPKQMWVVDDDGQVFEAMYGGSEAGLYHGYPIRRADLFSMTSSGRGRSCMAELSLDLVGWLTSAYGDEEVRATMGSLCISAGENDMSVAITEVEDTIGKTVRSPINVPLVSVATWLLMNWWRLRWEDRPAKPTTDWRTAHCLSGIGGDNAWPALEFSSDGAFIQLHMEAENRPDVSAIRYLRNIRFEVPAEKFEAAVERFVDVVEARLSTLLPQYCVLSELRAELAEERRSPSVAKVCRWQALAGIDPGEATEAWLRAAETLVEEAGPRAGDEIMGVLPELDEGIHTATHVLDMMKKSSTAVDLSGIGSAGAPVGRELPWQKGMRLAKEMRKRHRLGAGLLSNDTLSDLLSVPVPLPGQHMKALPLSGGFRNGVTNGRTKIIWPSSRPANQRFFLARMIGAALVLAPNEHVVPVTDKYSALQKVERAFAQEFLCPWATLDAFTDEHGVSDDALIEAAEHFQVSEWTVRSTLVNHGKISRGRLPSVV